MAQSEGIAGVDSFVLYGEETAYNTEQSTVDQHFGLIKSFTPRMVNNNSYSRGFTGSASGGRNVAKAIPGTVDHEIDIEMEVIVWDFLEFVLGAVAGTTTKTYTETNNPASLTVHRSIDNPGAASTDQDGIWTGCVIDSCTIKCAVGEPVTVSLKLLAAERQFDTSIPSNQALGTIEGFSFAGASIELPDTSTLPNIIDSMEITIENNYKKMPGLGSRFTQNARASERNYKIKFSVKYLDNALIQAIQGAAVPTGTTDPTLYASITANFDKGAHTTAFEFTTFTFDDHGGIENINEPIGEDLSGTAFSLQVVNVV